MVPDNVYKVGTNAYDGVSHCCFWCYSKWKDVYINDFLPIIYGCKPWSSRSIIDKNKFWVLLLKKAFAR